MFEVVDDDEVKDLGEVVVVATGDAGCRRSSRQPSCRVGREPPQNGTRSAAAVRASSSRRPCSPALRPPRPRSGPVGGVSVARAGCRRPGRRGHDRDPARGRGHPGTRHVRDGQRAAGAGVPGRRLGCQRPERLPDRRRAGAPIPCGSAAGRRPRWSPSPSTCRRARRRWSPCGGAGCASRSWTRATCRTAAPSRSASGRTRCRTSSCEPCGCRPGSTASCSRARTTARAPTSRRCWRRKAGSAVQVGAMRATWRPWSVTKLSLHRRTARSAARRCRTGIPRLERAVWAGVLGGPTDPSPKRQRARRRRRMASTRPPKTYSPSARTGRHCEGCGSLVGTVRRTGRVTWPRPLRSSAPGGSAGSTSRF